MPPVVFVMIDGLRPDAIEKAECPNLKKLIEHGASTLVARSVMPCITLPCHMSIFHSVPPSRHGVTTNDWSPMARPLPGLIEQTKNAGKRCAFFYNWEPLRNLSAPGNLQFAYFIDNLISQMADHVIADVAAEHIKLQQPDFAFVYFGMVDIAGHGYGWMADQYLEQIHYADEALGKVVAILPQNATLLVQADHGGHERNHGQDIPEDMTIPWVITGPNIKQNYRIQKAVSLLDTAPTLARILSIPIYREWEGCVVDEIFV